MRRPRINKNVKKIKVKAVGGQLEFKKTFRDS